MTEILGPNPAAPAAPRGTPSEAALNPPELGGNLLPPTYLGGPAISRDNCEREPIHIPGSVQPQGALAVADPLTLEVVQISENAGEYLPHGAGELLGRPLTALLAEADLGAMTRALPEGASDTLQYRADVTFAGRPPLTLTAHRAAGRLILEFEPVGRRPDAQLVRNALFDLENADSLLELADVAVRAVRDLTGFDRVMLYRFLPDDSGEVIAEARRADMGSFLRHRFPESDIPAQARALYVRHLLRLTADVSDAQVPLRPLLDPLSGQPAQLGGAVLRATSPIHMQYLRNMGVQSSLSVSIVTEGRLWGLIACHHETGLVVPPGVRAQMEYVGRLLNWQVRVKDRLDTDRFRAGLQERYGRLMSVAATTTQPLESLSAPSLELPELMRAGGAALVFEGQVRTLGHVPAGDFIPDLLRFLAERHPDEVVWASDCLGTDWPAAAGEGADPDVVRALASGVLALSVGGGWQEAVVWLRPELQTTVAWGGATPENAKGDLGPRTSFETYQERVSGHSEAWHPGEIEQAAQLQVSLTASLGERLSVMRDLNAALQRSNDDWQRLSFVVSHDMQEPVRLINVYAEMLQLRYGDALDGRAAQILGTIMGQARRTRSLSSDLYAYAELLGTPVNASGRVDLNAVVQGVLRGLDAEVRESGAQVTVGALPTVHGDADRLATALRHLLHNALTFRGEGPPQVRVQAQRQGANWLLSVTDDGPGIPGEYQERIFTLFQRLSAARDGRNGIGLTLARRIAQTHGGALEVQSALGEGSTFTLSLPAGPS